MYLKFVCVVYLKQYFDNYQKRSRFLSTNTNQDNLAYQIHPDTELQTLRNIHQKERKGYLKRKDPYPYHNQLLYPMGW